MINYLYYKIYKSYDKASLGNIPKTYAAGFSGVLIGINLLTLNMLLAKVNIIPFLFPNRCEGIFAVFCALVTFLYYGKNRREIVIKKYSGESKKESVRGGIAVIAYMILTFAIVIAIAWYKPGYLPQLGNLSH